MTAALIGDSAWGRFDSNRVFCPEVAKNFHYALRAVFVDLAPAHFPAA